MQSVENQFRGKVFDEDVLNFCLVLIEFVEKMPRESTMLRRVILDALTVNSSLQDVSIFIRSLNSLPLKQFSPHMGEFLDSCVKLSEQKVELAEFLMTLRHLAERSDFKAWSEFFSHVAISGEHVEFLENYLMTLRHLAEQRADFSWDEFFRVLRMVDSGTQAGFDFLMTVRHLAERSDFKAWEDFYSILRVASSNPQTLTDTLMTVRHLAERSDFKAWEDFCSIVRITSSNTRTLSETLMTIRHLAHALKFNEWDDFFKAIRILSSGSIELLNNFLLATRHVINYFRTSDSLKSIFRTMASVPQYSEACAFGQLDSKQWLIEEARKVWGDEWGRVFVLAGWIGFLPRFIFDSGIQVTGVRSFDIDPESGPAAESLNQSFVQKDWIFKSSTQDITKMTYPTNFKVQRKDKSEVEMFEMPEVVINTSCEHIADISSWWDQIPKGMRVIVQSNDAFHIPEHVRCFKNLADFEAAMNMSQVDYRGEKRLADFNRFMLIGRR